MIKNIIFDFDGVIVDSEILVAKAFSKYLKSLNIVFSEKDFSIYAGRKTFQVVDELSDKFKIKDKEIFFNDIMNLSKDIYSQELEPVEGARNFLEKNTKKIFIGSNSIKKRIMTGLKKIQFDNFFTEDRVFSFDSVKKPKPYPDIYLEVIKTHNLNKNETIIVEDSVVGVLSGVAAGVQVIGFTAGQHWYPDRSKQELIESNPLCIIDNYENLLEKVNNL